MSSEGASAALMLKHKIQQVQEELDRYKNLYDQSKQELEAEKKKRSQVLVARWAWPPLCRFAAYMTNALLWQKCCGVIEVTGTARGCDVVKWQRLINIALYATVQSRSL